MMNAALRQALDEASPQAKETIKHLIEDAARYRYLREYPVQVDSMNKNVTINGAVYQSVATFYCRETLDNAIDAESGSFKRDLL